MSQSIESFFKTSIPLEKRKESIIFPEPSKEQEAIIKKSSDFNNNIVLKSRSGTGKSTTALMIAQKNETRKYLYLCRNARLKFKINDLCNQILLKNLECHTFHSFCCEYFSKNCEQDEKIEEFLNKQGISVGSKKFCFESLIIDDAQDLEEIYYRVILLIIKNNELKRPQVILIGNIKLCPWKFHGASCLYFENPETSFSFMSRFEVLEPPMDNFRVPAEVVQFINKLSRKEIIKSDKKVNRKVCYIKKFESRIKERGSIVNQIVDKVSDYKNKDNIPEDQIFILARSTNHSLINKLKLKITERLRIATFVAYNDNKHDKKEIKGKLAFLSFHQAHGLERDAVIVLNFDNSVANKKKESRTSLQDPLLSALTRTNKFLTVVCNDRNLEHPLLENCQENIDYEIYRKEPVNNFLENFFTVLPKKPKKDTEEPSEKGPGKGKRDNKKIRYFQPRDLISQYPVDEMDKMKEDLKLEKFIKKSVSKEGKKVSLKIYECYMPIGLVEFQLSENMKMLESIKDQFDQLKSSKKILSPELKLLKKMTNESKRNDENTKQLKNELRKVLQEGNKSLLSRIINENALEDFAKITRLFYCVYNKRYLEINKIVEKISLKRSEIEEIAKNIKFQLPSIEKGEKYIFLESIEANYSEYRIEYRKKVVNFKALVHLIIDKKKIPELWAFNIKDRNDFKDVLEVAIWMWCFNKNRDLKTEACIGKIFNFQSGELWELNLDSVILSKIINNLLEFFYFGKKPLQKPEFETICEKWIESMKIR